MFLRSRGKFDGSRVINEFLALERCGIIVNLSDRIYNALYRIEWVD